MDPRRNWLRYLSSHEPIVPPCHTVQLHMNVTFTSFLLYQFSHDPCGIIFFIIHTYIYLPSSLSIQYIVDFLKTKAEMLKDYFSLAIEV